MPGSAGMSSTPMGVPVGISPHLSHNSFLSHTPPTAQFGSYEVSNMKRHRQRSDSVASMSSRVRSASFLEDKGIINREQKKQLKDLILSKDAEVTTAFARFEEGDAAALENLVKSGALTRQRQGSFDLLEDLDLNFLEMEPTRESDLSNGYGVMGELDGVDELGDDDHVDEPIPVAVRSRGNSLASQPPVPFSGSLEPIAFNPMKLGDGDSGGFQLATVVRPRRSAARNRGGGSSNTTNNTATPNYSQTYNTPGSTIPKPSMNPAPSASNQFQVPLPVKTEPAYHQPMMGTLPGSAPIVTNNVPPLPPPITTIKTEKCHGVQPPIAPSPFSNILPRSRSNSLALPSSVLSAPVFHPPSPITSSSGLETDFSPPNSPPNRLSLVDNDHEIGDLDDMPSFEIIPPAVRMSARQKVKAEKEAVIRERHERRMEEQKRTAKLNTAKQKASRAASRNTSKSSNKSRARSAKPISIPSGNPFAREDVDADDAGIVDPKNPRMVGAYSPQSRKARIERFLEKRKHRVWKKEIKYDVRKNFANSRLRVKGRFVKKEDEMLLRELLACA